MCEEADVLFSVGEKFYTFEELEDRLRRIKEATGMEYWRSDSKTVETARKRIAKPLPKTLQYYEVRYGCKHSSRKLKKKTTDDCTKTLNHSRGCKAYVYLVASKDSDCLVVRSLNNEHNHEVDVEKESEDQAGEVDDSTDLNMMCSDVVEVDPSSVIEMLLDDEDLMCEVYVDDDNTQLDNVSFLSNIAAVDEVTDVELKQEIEQLTAASSENMTSSVSNKPAAEKSTDDLQQQCTDDQVSLASKLRAAQVKQSFACDVCGQLYARPTMLEKHRRKHESGYDRGETVIGRSPLNVAAVSANDATSEVVITAPVGDVSGYICGECGQKLDTEAEVKSHMFTMHMSMSQERVGLNGEVQVVRFVIPPRVIPAPAAQPKSSAGDSNSIERLNTDSKTSKCVPDKVEDQSHGDVDQEDEKPDLTTGMVVSEVVDRPKDSELQRRPKLCPVCGKMFRSLEVHMRLHRHPGFECTDCGRKFARKDYLTEHRRIHSHERPYLCVKCGRSFASSSNLRTHLNTHTDERRYQCEQCGKFFRRRCGKAEHIRHVHEKVKAHRCTSCPQAYTTLKGLKVHMMSHTNERPYACPNCPKRFKTAAVLDLHLVTHTGERRFACSFCGQRFSQKTAARMHERTQHSEDGGRSHECELCGQRFSKRSIRDAHVRRHNGIKPHSCTMCNWAFAFLGDLRNHMIKKHKVKRNASAGRPQHLVAT